MEYKYLFYCALWLCFLDRFWNINGITYYFTTTDKNGKIKTGKTWSPNKKSLLGRLVKICDNLYSLGIGKNIDQSKITKEITILINDLTK